tara:strand:+ start:49 stop:276 length:228 start_codon:yes stop_codon:yes gene_type:complete
MGFKQDFKKYMEYAVYLKTGVDQGHISFDNLSYMFYELYEEDLLEKSITIKDILEEKESFQSFISTYKLPIYKPR